MLLSISLYVLAAGLGGAQLAVAVAGAAAAETSARVADQTAMAAALCSMGHYSDAIRLYESAIARSGVHIQVYPPYVRCLQEEGGWVASQWQELLRRMQVASSQCGAEDGRVSPGADLSEFLQTMSITAELAGEFEASWKYLTLSNEAQLKRYSRERAVHNSDIESRSGDRLPWPLPLTAWDEGIEQRIQPIFVAGLPNSGVEELIALLDSQHDIVGMAARPEYFRNLAMLTDHTFRYGAFDMYRSQAIDLLARMRNGGGGHRAHRPALTEFRKGLENTYMILAQHAVGSGVKFGSPGIEDVRYIVDHSPSSFAYLREPLTLYPRSIAIHVVRDDPMDAVVLNYMHRQFGRIGVNVGKSLWAYDLNSTVSRVRVQREHMRRLKAECALQLSGSSDGACPRLIELKYSEIVNSPSKVLSRVLRALGIDASRRVLDDATRQMISVSADDFTSGMWTRYNQDCLRRLQGLVQ